MASPPLTVLEAERRVIDAAIVEAEAMAAADEKGEPAERLARRAKAEASTAAKAEAMRVLEQLQADVAGPQEHSRMGKPNVRAHDLFISYAVEPDKHTFVTLRDTFLALCLDVFNPDMDLAVAGGATAELMQAHVRASKLVLAVMSRGAPIFKSQWCRAELSAACRHSARAAISAPLRASS